MVHSLWPDTAGRIPVWNMRMKHLPSKFYSCGNYTVSGSTIDGFRAFISAIGDGGWSAICDKDGNWAVSTQDDTTLDELLAAVRPVVERIEELEIEPYGEMTFSFHRVYNGCMGTGGTDDRIVVAIDGNGKIIWQRAADL